MAIKAALKDQELAGRGHRLRRRATPRQRHRLPAHPDPRGGDPGPVQDRLLRLLRRGGARRRCRRPTAGEPGAGRGLRVHPGADARTRSSSPLPARSRCRAGSATPATPTRPTWSGRSPAAQRRGPGAGRGRCRPAADRRAVPGRLSGAGGPGRRGGQHRHRRAWPPTWALHVCYGNRYARPLWEGHYDFLFPRCWGARRPARAGVRPQGPGRPAAAAGARLGPRPRPRRHRRKSSEVESAGSRRGPDPPRARAWSRRTG